MRKDGDLMLRPVWRPDGSLVIETQAEVAGGGAGLFRFLLTPEAVEELREVLENQPPPREVGEHERTSSGA